jgi:hypothetical protein
MARERFTVDEGRVYLTKADYSPDEIRELLPELAQAASDAQAYHVNLAHQRSVLTPEPHHPGHQVVTDDDVEAFSAKRERDMSAEAEQLAEPPEPTPERSPTPAAASDESNLGKPADAQRGADSGSQVTLEPTEPAADVRAEQASSTTIVPPKGDRPGNTRAAATDTAKPKRQRSQASRDKANEKRRAKRAAAKK